MLNEDIAKERHLANNTREAASAKLDYEKHRPTSWWRGRDQEKIDKLKHVTNQAAERAFGLRGDVGHRSTHHPMNRVASFKAHNPDETPTKEKLLPKSKAHKRKAAAIHEEYAEGLINILIENEYLSPDELLEFATTIISMLD